MVLANNTTFNGFSPRKAAFISGISLLLMAVAAAFSFGYVFNTTVMPDNATATATQIKASLSLFQMGIIGWLLIFILDIVVGWALYVFFKGVNKNMALVAALLRWVYSAFLAVAIFQLIAIVLFADNAESTMQYINSFLSIWNAGLIVFGLHLVALSYLALQSGFVPKFFGILLLVAGLSYSLLSDAKIMMPEFETQIKTAEMILSLPMAASEIALAVWLLVKNRKLKLFETERAIA